MGGVELLTVLRAADPDAPMWSWGADRRARFWPRRMLHEATVHRADAELALGFAPGVTELRGSGETLRFRCTDDAAAWTVRLAADGYTWDTAAVPSPTCEVAGTASDLLLGVYGRIPIGAARYDVTGDRAVLERWIEKSAI
jgi:hypothetical protein